MRRIQQRLRTVTEWYAVAKGVNVFKRGMQNAAPRVMALA
jgi:hypothetical protein